MVERRCAINIVMASRLTATSRIVSLISREAAEELGLEPGVRAIAAVKSTNVVVEMPR